jgi:GT2 family glycosyltransferase
VQKLHEARPGLSAARNCAIRSARGTLIAWTDDDCRLDEDYVVNLLRHDAGDKDPVLRGGRVELGDSADLPLSIKTDRAPRRWSRRTDAAGRDQLSTSIIGCNMAMRRVLIDIIGLFDERFGAGTSIPGGEETDYIYRVWEAGFEIAYDPDMVVHHYHGRKEQAVARKLLKNYIVGTGGLYAKHMFKAVRPDRPAPGDFWRIVKEFVSGKNYFLADSGILLRQFVGYWSQGVAKYVVASIKKNGRS